MKRHFLTALILIAALSAAVHAVNPSSYVNAWAMFFTSSTGTPETVTSTNPLPVGPKGATSVSDEEWIITTTPASWTLSSTATDYAIWNLGTSTVWVSHNDGGATASHDIPVTASGTLARDGASGMVIWAVAPATTVCHRAEGRR